MPADPRSSFDAFLDACQKDLAAAAVRPLSEYLRLYPGNDSDIAREFLRLNGGTATDGGAATLALGTPAVVDDGVLQRFGPYRILRELGRGGQGVVYLAEDTRLPRRVALKALTGTGARSGEELARFRREAIAASRVDHVGICPVFEAGAIDGTPFIAMRHVEGEPLSKKIATGKSSAIGSKPSAVLLNDVGSAGGGEGTTTRQQQTSRTADAGVMRVVRLVEQTARALHAAHVAGVVHRDIKPANIMIGNDGQPVILDFGLAAILDDTGPALTVTGEFFGTIAYMSPEQLTANRIKLDSRTDVFSLGVTLFECLTLNRPFEHPTRQGVVHAIQVRPTPDSRTFNPAISRELQVVIETALEKDRDRRYQTALDLADDLRRVRAFEPILAKPAGPMLRLRRWSQRNPALATAVLGVVVALVISVVLLVQTQRERDLKDSALAGKDAALALMTTERNAKEVALADYNRLGDVSRLKTLVAEAELLWPAEAATVPAMTAWLGRADDIGGNLAGHQRALDALRASPGVLQHPGTARTDGPATQSRGQAPQDGGTWQFREQSDQFRHDTLTALVVDLGAFVDPDPRKGCVANVRERMRFATDVERDTITTHGAKWAEAIASISDPTACPRYKGLKIARQLGLIPLGLNRQSGLWEFSHLQTTAAGPQRVPERGTDGGLIVQAGTGIVFVLIPGGTFNMGAESRPADGAAPSPNVDPEALENEGPVDAVPLSAFFLSKYEMTQGQWLRLVGTNPSTYAPGMLAGGKPVDLRHPVENVSYDECESWLGRMGLVLPTEAQWEYAARGGTATPWWCGESKETLVKAANVADAFAHEHGNPAWPSESWNDGFAVHAPVGSFAPNGFGLHDVAGNVSEWCRDWLGGYAENVRPGDGLRMASAQSQRVYRGGSFMHTAADARSAARNQHHPSHRNGILGVRPARVLAGS